jgi:hypothetical protein
MMLMPPKISLELPPDESVRVPYAGRYAHAGIVHNGNVSCAWWDPSISGNVFHIGTKRIFRKFPVEKRRGTPYGTRSYLPGGAA